MVRDVEVYLKHTNESNDDVASLFSMPQLEEFLVHMKTKFKPSTRKKKLLRIKMAIKFVIRSVDDQQLYYKGQRVMDSIDEWCSGLNGDIAVQKQEYGLVVREKIKDMTDPNEFLSNEMVQ